MIVTKLCLADSIHPLTYRLIHPLTDLLLSIPARTIPPNISSEFVLMSKCRRYNAESTKGVHNALSNPNREKSRISIDVKQTPINQVRNSFETSKRKSEQEPWPIIVSSYCSPNLGHPILGLLRRAFKDGIYLLKPSRYYCSG